MNFNIYFVAFRKMKYVWGYEDCVDFLGCHHKTGLVLGVFYMHAMAIYKPRRFS